jgi:HK97 family phage prohead protease
MSNSYEIKSISVDQSSITDIDEKQGRIIGYFSKFGNVDADGDLIVPGAFTKSLQENYKRLKHLYQHDPFKPLAGTRDGKLSLKEDSYGLAFDSTISKTSWGRDVIQLHLDGVIDENSIGFVTIRANNKNSHRELIELKLFEGSSVTWGANPMAVTNNVKSLYTPLVLEKKMQTVMSAIRKGKYENEEIFEAMELWHKQLIQLLTEKTTEPVLSASLTVPPVTVPNEDRIQRLKNLNSLFPRQHQAAL